MDCSSASDNFSTYHLHVVYHRIQIVPLDVCECIEPVPELEHSEHRDVYVCACDVVTNAEAAAVFVVEEPHLSSLAAAASIIARKVTPAPVNAPAKNTASVLIVVLPPHST